MGRAEVKVKESFQTPLRGVQQGKPALKGQGSCSGPHSQRVAELDGPPGGLVHLFLKSRQPGAPVLRGTTAGLSPIFRTPTLEECGPPGRAACAPHVPSSAAQPLLCKCESHVARSSVCRPHSGCAAVRVHVGTRLAFLVCVLAVGITARVWVPRLCVHLCGHDRWGAVGSFCFLEQTPLRVRVSWPQWGGAGPGVLAGRGCAVAGSETGYLM